MRLPEILCADERGEAYGEVGLEAFGDGEQSGVAPDVGRAGGDVFLGEDAADGFEVIGDFEGVETVGAGGEGLIAKSLATLVALQLVPATGVVHQTLSEGKSDELFDFFSLGGPSGKLKYGAAFWAECSESHVPWA